METNFLTRKSLIIIASILLSFFIIQSTYSQRRRRKKSSGVANKINPSFTYSPAERESVASAGVTIALLNPIFLDSEINVSGSPWTDFAKAMGNDVEELLMAKGFKVRGPFGSIDEMVFSDKRNSDFVVQIIINIEIKNDRKMKVGANLLSLSNNYSYRIKKGDVTINSNVILTASSCFTSEKLWKKNLNIAQKNFTYVGSIKWDGLPSVVTEFNRDVNLWNPICKDLEEIYKTSFDILYRQFDKDEMVNLASEARKADGSRRD